MEASITFKAVGKAIGKETLLADLSFGVEKGSTFVILGENGSGKSVILKLLVGLIEKDTGNNTAKDMVELIPGKAPRTIPSNTPKTSNVIANGSVKTCKNTLTISFIMVS